MMNDSQPRVQLSSAAPFARFPWAWQFLRFGSVGALATLIHVVAYAGFIETVGVTPVTANVLAFSIAVAVSFAGHASWTFRHEYRQSGRGTHVLFARFAISAVLGLLLNTLFVFVLVTWLGLAYGWAIPGFVFITPLVLFIVNRLWVFT